MKKFIGSFILNLAGWTTYYPHKYKINKCVMITAPHTSIFDYFYTTASFWEQGVRVRFVYSKKYFPYYYHSVLKFIGGIDCGDKSITDFSVDLFNENEKLILLIPVEGTKHRVEKWKTGFYHIARLANVPIALGYLDYDDKVAGVGDLFKVSDVIVADLLKIQNFYKNFMPKNPEKYNSTIY